MATATTDQAALVALTTAILSGRDLEAVLVRILSGEVDDLPPQGPQITSFAGQREVDESVDFAFRDRTRVKKAARLVTSLLPPERPLLGRSGGPASLWARRTSPARRAAYALAAARRLAVPEPDLAAERRFLAQHMAAERARTEAAGRTDMVVAQHGPVVGWRATLDDVTSPGCRAAHGGNFLPQRPPIVEGGPALPGTVHGGSCRCIAAPPWPGGRLLA